MTGDTNRIDLSSEQTNIIIYCRIRLTDKNHFNRTNSQCQRAVN